MSNAIKIAVPLLLLAAVAGGVAWFVNQSTPAPAPAPITRPTEVQTPDPAPPQPAKADPAPVVVTQDPVRTAAPVTTGDADAPQGVRGRVMLPDGQPAANVPVMLVENMMNDAIRVFLMNRTTKAATVATTSTTTAEDGSFALGVRQLGKAFDLRIVSPDHPERNLPQIKVKSGDWYDTGELRLELGLVVQGTVTEEITNRGIEGATVFLVGTSQSHSFIATPGRERGITAVTDARGFYRFTSAPTQGLVNLSVEAAGYASSPVLNQQLRPQGPTDVNFQVVAGQPISGVVVDTQGRPLASVVVSATGLSSKTPQSATTASGADGTFSFPNLRAGPYALVATLARHVDAREQSVMTGDTSVKLVLSERPSVKLRVLGANQAPVKSYRLSLMRYFPNNPAGVGKVMDFADISVTPADYPAEFGGEWAVIHGVPLGEFRWQVQDSAHAKTLSPPFTVVDGGGVPETIAELTLGGVLTGTVIDDRGKPVADAIVTTDMNGGPAADLGLLEIFKSMMPERHTKSQAKTDAQGRFRISKLAFADYMVRVAHPDYCEGSAIDIKLETVGQVLDVGVIQLSLGAVVEGIARVGGQPAGQVKIQLSTPMPTPPAPGTQPNQGPDPQLFAKMFHATVVSDGDGKFRMLKRVPPGVYRVTANRQVAENPFFNIIDQKNSEQQLTIQAGQERVQLSFDLPAR